MIETFLNELYRLSAISEDDSNDLIMQFMDDQQLAGSFDVCNKVFELVDESKLTPSGVISLLMITIRAIPLLPARVAFCDKAVSVLYKEEPLRANKIIDKYR